MLTLVSDVHGDHQPESPGWLFQSLLAGGGGILWRPHYRPHSLFVLFMSQVHGHVPCWDIAAGDSHTVVLCDDGLTNEPNVYYCGSDKQ